MARSMAFLTRRSRVQYDLDHGELPLYLGGDLTQLDNFAKSAFTNDELLAVDQSGLPAVQVTGGPQPVWMSKQADGSIYVAVYNLNGLTSKVTVPWSDLRLPPRLAVRAVGPIPSLARRQLRLPRPSLATAHVC